MLSPLLSPLPPPPPPLNVDLPPPSLSEIIKDQVYLGNLSAALSETHRRSIRATHLLSVCPDYPSSMATANGAGKNENESSGLTHLTIPVQDSEYEDLLVHLPRACQFIESVLAGGGESSCIVLWGFRGVRRWWLHTSDGTVMKTMGMDAAAAIKFIKHKRPQIHPNYGFITQLMTFAACRYDPCPTNSTYRAWKKKQKQIVTLYLNHIADATVVLRDKMLLSSCYPEDPLQAESLIRDLGVSHLLVLSPCKIPPTIPTSTSLVKYQHIPLSEKNKDELIVALPEACRFIRQAVENDGTVLVHCLVESKACIVVCASLMEMKGLSPKAAFDIIEAVLPLFNPTRKFYQHLELFAACGHKPTKDHNLVRDWVRSQGPSYITARSSSYASSTSSSSSTSSPGPSTPPSYVSSRTSSSSSYTGSGLVTRKAQSWYHVHNDSLTARAAGLLSDSDGESKFDLGAFGQALVAIQESRTREDRSSCS